MKRWIWVAVVLLLGGACKKSDMAKAKKRIREQAQWEAVWILGQKPDSVQTPRPRLRFDFANALCAGNGGCNTYQAILHITEKDLSISNLTAFKALCGQPRDGMEAAFFNALSRTSKARAKGDDLELLEANGNTLLVLTPALW
ncbi:MAG: META domain-containing protein [Bacteroidetes bacterium]|nr:META domain-containing protein [Bacteroidota bacterium]